MSQLPPMREVRDRLVGGLRRRIGRVLGAARDDGHPTPSGTTHQAAPSVPPPLELLLGTYLGRSDVVSELHDPLAFLTGLQECLAPATFALRWTREDEHDDDAARRFVMVTEHLRWGAPPIRMRDAWEIGLATDELLGSRLPYAQGAWLGDVGAHSRLSSTAGRRGRLLATVVRYMRPRTCVEVGTAYGLSSMFILAELRALDDGGRLATIEPWEPQLSLATSLLERAHKGRVTCHGGTAQEILPGLLPDIAPVDFVFHDGLHTGDAYRADFAALEPSLAPGAVVLIDDIRNDIDPFGTGVDPRTYEGWTDIVSHPRVRRAVEIDGALGLLLLR